MPDAAGEVPAIERRRWPRRSRHHEAHVHWKHIAVYVPIVVLVIVLGGLALWSFVERQSLVIVPEPIPRVTLVTADPDSPLTAAWVRLLTAAAIETTVVRAPVASHDGLVARCGSGIALLGMPPANAPVRLTAERGTSDNALKLGATPSPILARLTPGGLLPARPAEVALLEEKPAMRVDARWRDNARAAVMHMEMPGSRLLWMGIDPGAIAPGPAVLLMLRTSFRWLAQQPISSGRNEGLVVTVERLRDRKSFAVKMLNRTQQRIMEPTAQIWFPQGVTRVALDGDVIMRRGATLVSQEEMCILSLPSLAANEERILKLTAR